MKAGLRLVVIGLALAVGWTLGVWEKGGPGPGLGGDAAHAAPTVEQVQALSSLVTERVQVADIVEERLEGYTGAMKAVLVIRGDVLLGVDLSQASFRAVDPSARTAVLVLPPPQVSNPRVDHERTKVFAVSESGLWQIAPGGGQACGELVDRGYHDAQRLVGLACADPALTGRARGRVEQVVQAAFGQMHWSVSVRWKA